MQVRSKDVQQVIDIFKTVLPQGGKLSMMESGCTVNKHGCGTVHCHGGWFAIALGLPKYHGHDGKGRWVSVNYATGGNMMARILGLKDKDQLTDWAHENPKIWGNKNGNIMFSAERAFGSETNPGGANDLQDIVDHWQDVYNRLYQLEHPVEITDPPVYIETYVKEQQLMDEEEEEYDVEKPGGAYDASNR